MNIVLCGMMGCGKTTVAAELAARGYTVVDTDEVIVGRYGDINGIFAADVAKKYDGAVISLGGGCVLRAGNVKNLKTTGRIFYLRAKAETLIKRLKGDTSRPLLQGGLEEKVNSILSARAHIYESVADFIIDTDGLTPAEIAKIIEDTVL